MPSNEVERQPISEGTGSKQLKEQKEMEWAFGKHKGLPASQVPLSYLIWCSEQMLVVPDCVVEELKRRSSFDVRAGAAVSSLVFLKHSRKKKKKRGRRRAHSRSQQKQEQPVKQVAEPIVGEHYERLLNEFEAMEGDNSSCPFGESYDGPRIAEVDGVPRMVWLGLLPDKR